MTKQYIACLIACFMSLTIFAQSNEMETDRPGQSVAPELVIKGAVQLEAGLSEQYQKTDGQKHAALLYPAALIRYGLLKKLELRLQMDYEGDYDFEPAKHQTAGGFKPLQLGIKYSLLEAKGAIPQMALVAGVALPKIASQDFQADFVAPAFTLAMENELTKKISLVYNVGLRWEPSDVHAQYIYTLAPQFDISDHLKVFGELYGILSATEKPDHRMDAGLAYLIRPNLQLDLLGGIGISPGAPNHFFELGCSFRLPH